MLWIAVDRIILLRQVCRVAAPAYGALEIMRCTMSQGEV